MHQVERQTQRFWWGCEFHSRWADREHEAALTGDGLILLKLRVHERDAEGMPTRVSLLRQMVNTPENDPTGSWARWAAEHPAEAADYWGDPVWKARLARALGLAPEALTEDVIFTLDDVVRLVRRVANVQVQQFAITLAEVQGAIACA